MIIKHIVFSFVALVVTALPIDAAIKRKKEDVRPITEEITNTPVSCKMSYDGFNVRGYYIPTGVEDSEFSDPGSDQEVVVLNEPQSPLQIDKKLTELHHEGVTYIFFIERTASSSFRFSLNMNTYDTDTRFVVFELKKRALMILLQYREAEGSDVSGEEVTNFIQDLETQVAEAQALYQLMQTQ